MALDVHNRPALQEVGRVMFTYVKRQLVWAALVGLVVGAHAQSDRRGSISGVVSSSSGEPMVSVTVVIQNLDTNVKQQTTTDASGNYRFDRTEPGRYSLTATSNGTSGTPADVINILGASVAQVEAQEGSQSVQEIMSAPQNAAFNGENTIDVRSFRAAN
jgi:hypothetical protein